MERPIRARAAQRVDPQSVPANQSLFGGLPAFDRPAVVQTYQGLTLLADDPERRGREDDVLGVGPSGLTLARMTPRRPVRRALDIGCGGGLQALLMARHAAQVVATDVNPRALACTEENARANGMGNISLLMGDLFEPLAGQRYDLIVANPPFVLSPDHQFLYRDGGTEDGGICRRTLSQIQFFLKSGGIACVQCEWPISRGQRWWTTIHQWTRDSGCDVWLHGYVIATAERHARVWLSHVPDDQHRDFDGDLRRWLDWYEQNGIERIGGGVVFLKRRPSASHWMRSVFTPSKPSEDCGDQNSSHLRSADQPDASGRHPGLAQNALSAGAGGPLARRNGLDQSRSSIGTPLELTLDIPESAREVFRGLDGARPLGEVIRDSSDRRILNRASWTEAVVQIVRHAYGLGMLTRGDRPDAH